MVLKTIGALEFLDLDSKYIFGPRILAVHTYPDLYVYMHQELFLLSIKLLSILVKNTMLIWNRIGNKIEKEI